MHSHTAAIIAGLAVGAFLGYEFSATLVTYPPYSWIANAIAGTSS